MFWKSLTVRGNLVILPSIGQLSWVYCIGHLKIKKNVALDFIDFWKEVILGATHS